MQRGCHSTVLTTPLLMGEPSAEDFSEPEQVQYRSLYNHVCNQALIAYERMIEDGVCPEQARFVLPQGMETSWIWTGSLAAYSRFCKQRMDSHAQKEVRELAGLVSDIVGGLFPISWAALTNEKCANENAS